MSASPQATEHPELPTMAPGDFIAKWRTVELKERSASQSHFIDLCRLLGEPTPTDADPAGEWYCFERGARKVRQRRACCLTLRELERWLTVVICKDYHQSGHRNLDGAAPIARLEEGLAALGRAGGRIAVSRDPRRYPIDFLPVLRRTLQ